MISKLPPWVWSGAWALAFVAGMGNTVGLLGFEHQAVTHLTGTTSLFGVAVANLDAPGVIHLLAVLVSFLVGAVLSGIIIRDSTLKLGRHYGVALMIETVLLCVAVPFLKRHNPAGAYIASCAFGLQNAMVTTYSGSIVRTTHLTGIFTDLGILVGHAIRGLPVDTRRIRLCAVIISAFLCGGVAGTFGFRTLGYDTLFIPAGLIGITGAMYGFYSLRSTGKIPLNPPGS